LSELRKIVGIATRVSRLGARPADRARLFVGTFALLASAQTPRRGRDRLRVTIRAFDREGRVTLSDYSHILLLEAIFLDGDYAVEPLAEPRVIVDLGSNVGLSILFLSLRFPGARIVGIEPDPAAFALLEGNARGRAEVRHAAVGDREGEATFWSAPGAVASSLHRTHDAQRPVTVPVHTLRHLLEDFGIERVDVLKLVVEGSELVALRSLGDLRRVDAITGEILLPDAGARAELEALLAGFDLRLHEDKGDGFWQFHARRLS
jgi:FkbM family methyltransferase